MGSRCALVQISIGFARTFIVVSGFDVVRRSSQ